MMFSLVLCWQLFSAFSAFFSVSLKFDNERQLILMFSPAITVEIIVFLSRTSLFLWLLFRWVIFVECRRICIRFVIGSAPENNLKCSERPDPASEPAVFIATHQSDCLLTLWADVIIL